jgi:hypothetical protein
MFVYPVFNSADCDGGGTCYATIRDDGDDVLLLRSRLAEAELDKLRVEDKPLEVPNRRGPDKQLGLCRDKQLLLDRDVLKFALYAYKNKQLTMMTYKKLSFFLTKKLTVMI